MATSSLDTSSTFLTRSSSIRTQIKSNFSRLVQRINTRRNDLLKKLDQYESRYKQLAEESEQAFNKLEDLRHSSRDLLNLTLLNRFQTKIQSYIDNEVTDLEREIGTMDVTFEWDDTVEHLVSDLGTLCIHNPSKDNVHTIDYKSKSFPVKTNKFLDFTQPRAICIDRVTSNMYITAKFGTQSSVYVYSKEGAFLLRIGEHDKDMDSPHGIAVFDDRIYVSQFSSNSVLKYQLLHSPVPKRTSTLACPKGSLSNPTLLSIDESNCHVYVCDTGNKRVVRYTKYLRYHSDMCGDNGSIPIDVKVSENYILILFTPGLLSNSFEICLFSKSDGNPFQKSILKKFLNEAQSCSFDLDLNENILMSLSRRKSICVYNICGDLIHSIDKREVFSDEIQSIDCFAFDKNTGDIVVICGKNIILTF